MRRHVFIPGLVMCVPRLVLMKGGDALSVAFNTIAILFLCEVVRAIAQSLYALAGPSCDHANNIIVFVQDNVAYLIAMNERVRARVDVAGRISLSNSDITALARTKAVHIVFVVFCVFYGISIHNYHGQNFPPLIAMAVGALLETFRSGDGAKETCIRIGQWFVSIVIGQLLFFVNAGLSG